MADWRQIQARIRKAKTSSDPPAQLAELYERTRDAMVAFELAQFHEKAGNAGETVQWYTTAAQRFRRAQWRTKAEEALTRLGAPIPEAPQVPVKDSDGDVEAAKETSADPEAAEGIPRAGFGAAEGDSFHAGNGRQHSAADAAGESEESEEQDAAPTTASSALGAGKRRRRGRRGGRRRRAHSGTGPQATGDAASQRPTPTTGAHVQSPAASHAERRAVESSPEHSPESRHEASHTTFEPPAESRSLAARGGAVGSAWQGGSGGLVSSRSRTGDPGLSSRIAQLESQLRRLLACPLASLEEADQAPAGPGVLLLSDSDQVTHYYVEACQTLRIGVGNLLRGGRGAKGGAQLKPSMAEHLGINESRVAKYLKDHCAVRWIQLDEGAAELAHFATSVLRPVVTE